MATQPKLSAEDKKWQAEEDLRTLQRAKEIRDDPARMKAAADIAGEQMKALMEVGAAEKMFPSMKPKE